MMDMWWWQCQEVSQVTAGHMLASYWFPCRPPYCTLGSSHLLPVWLFSSASPLGNPSCSWNLGSTGPGSLEWCHPGLVLHCPMYRSFSPVLADSGPFLQGLCILELSCSLFRGRQRGDCEGDLWRAAAAGGSVCGSHEEDGREEGGPCGR